MILVCLLIHKYTWYASGCETEYVCGTCVDFNSAYIYHWRTLVEVERIKGVKCRDRLYKREFERLFGAYFFTNTQEYNLGYLYDWRTLAEVESIKTVKCRDRVYKREFERFSGDYIVTNAHGMAVVVWQNMCGVPVRTWFRHISMIEGLWRKLRAQKQWIVESVTAQKMSVVMMMVHFETRTLAAEARRKTHGPTF